MKIKMDYAPRGKFIDIHNRLENHRFSVVVAHRRFGKTVGLINHTIKQALSNTRLRPQYAIVAPFLKQVKMIAWEYLKYYTRVFPNTKVNESELWVEFLGRRVQLFGADNPDAMRGAYFDGVILDEYAQIKQDVWDEIIFPAITDRDGWVVFSGTPKGQNHFSELYQRALREFAVNNEGDWWAGIYPITETGIFTAAQIELIRSTMSENKFRQEYMCDFTASNDDILLTIGLVTASANREISRDVYGTSARVMGVDVARYGDDGSVIAKRQGLQVFPLIKKRKLSNMELADLVAYNICDFNPVSVNIDAGRGEGVIDRLRQLGYGNIVEINSASSPRDQHYENKRAEMWDAGRKWMEAGGAIPNDELLKADLTAPIYFINGKGRMQLERKEDIKKRIGRSPDTADAVMLTLATNIAEPHSRPLTRAALQKNGGVAFDPSVCRSGIDLNTAFNGRGWSKGTGESYNRARGTFSQTAYDPFNRGRG